MTVIYADANDYLDVMQAASGPDNIASLLRSASLLIRGMTISAVYTVDAVTFLPTDAVKLEAFREATCIQAAAWSALGIDPNLAALDVTAPKRGKGIGSARVDYDTSAASSAAAFAARQLAAVTLCPDAMQILRDAGLLSSHVWPYG